MALLAAGLLAPAGVEALADDDRPVQLLPGLDAQPLEPDYAPENEDVFQPQKPARSKDAVEIDELEAVGPDGTGLGESAGGNLPATIWRGSKRDYVEALMARLPTSGPSLTMRRLAIGLLATQATPPEGGGPPGSFLSARAGALAAMGEYQIAAALLANAPTSPALDAVRARIETDLDFLAGGEEFARACTHTREEVKRSGEPYWQKALIFCQIIGGEAEAGRIGLDVLRDGGEPDKAFLVLADAVLGSKAKLEALPDPTPLHFAMLKRAKRPIPESASEGANPALMRLIAASADTPMKLRLAAVERAELAGTVPAESVGKFYEVQQFKKAELTNPLKAAEKLSGPMARALIYRAILAEPTPDGQAKLMQAGFARARQDKAFPMFARVVFPLLAKIEQTPALAFFAGDAARALLAGGEPAMAKRWHTLAAEQGRSDPALFDIAVSLWPVMALAEQTTGEPFKPDLFDAWLKVNGGTATPEAAQRASLTVTLMKALGLQVPDQVVLDITLGGGNETASVPPPALVDALGKAAAEQRSGETGLLSLAALGNDGPTRASTLTLALTVQSLNNAGLALPARTLALEAALGKGL